MNPMANSAITTKFYSDAGHGWYAVKIKTLVALGIADKISSFSYMKGQTAYLEEDSDAAIFFNTCKKMFFSVVTVQQSHTGRSPIRSYAPYITEEQAIANANNPVKMDATKFLNWCITNDVRGTIEHRSGKNLHVKYEFMHDGGMHARTIYGHHSVQWVM
jgi:hypothetical protein